MPEVYYGAGSRTLTGEQIGTRYVGTAVRTLVDPDDPADLEKAVALQDAIEVEQPGGPGTFEVPNWDQASQKKVRDALLTLAETLPDTRRAFGPRGQVDPVRRLIQAAQLYLAAHPALALAPCRFDVAAASGDPDAPRIDWIVDAFRLDDV